MFLQTLSIFILNIFFYNVHVYITNEMYQICQSMSVKTGCFLYKPVVQSTVILKCYQSLNKILQLKHSNNVNNNL